MSNDDKDRNDSAFPAPFEYLEEFIANDLQIYSGLDEELKKLQLNSTKAKPYQLNYQVPGFSIGEAGKNFEGAAEKIQKQKKEALGRMYLIVNREAEKLEINPEAIQELKDVVYKKTHPDPLKNKSPLERNAHMKKSKDLEESQQHVYYLLENSKTTNKAKSKLKQFSKEDRSPGKE